MGVNSSKSCKAKSWQWPTSEAAWRGRKEVQLGKTWSDMTVNPKQIRNLPRHFCQIIREYHSADSSRDILQATGGDEGGEGGRNICRRLARRPKSQSRRDYSKKSIRHAGRPTTQHFFRSTLGGLQQPPPPLRVGGGGDAGRKVGLLLPFLSFFLL